MHRQPPAARVHRRQDKPFARGQVPRLVRAEQSRRHPQSPASSKGFVVIAFSQPIVDEAGAILKIAADCDALMHEVESGERHLPRLRAEVEERAAGIRRLRPSLVISGHSTVFRADREHRRAQRQLSILVECANRSRADLDACEKVLTARLLVLCEQVQPLAETVQDPALRARLSWSGADATLAAKAHRVCRAVLEFEHSEEATA
jgi:hypothetical protein